MDLDDRLVAVDGDEFGPGQPGIGGEMPDEEQYRVGMPQVQVSGMLAVASCHRWPGCPLGAAAWASELAHLSADIFYRPACRCAQVADRWR
jgi:hypothetical protein